jgi:uncharacterized protein involved in exopolysaccharide biosynthesis
MELIDYLRVGKQRLWILIGVPVLAAALAAGVILIQPQKYTATATVSALALVGGQTGNTYNGSQAVSQYASAFQATAQGPAVRNAVAAQTGVGANGLASSVTVTQVGASSTMTITYTDPKQKLIQPVLHSLTAETLKAMFGTQVALAQQQVTDATANVATANAAITAWSAKTGQVDPTAAYQLVLNHIQSLQQLQAANLAAGHSTGAAALSGSIAAANASLAKYAPLIATYNGLTATRDAAVQSLSAAQQSLSAAKQQQGAANPAQVVFFAGTHTVSNGSQLLTTALPIGAAGIFVAIFLIGILELLKRARAERAEEEANRSSRTAAAAKDADPATEPEPEGPTEPELPEVPEVPEVPDVPEAATESEVPDAHRVPAAAAAPESERVETMDGNRHDHLQAELDGLDGEAESAKKAHPDVAAVKH